MNYFAKFLKITFAKKETFLFQLIFIYYINFLIILITDGVSSPTNI